jgi:hypothetical protein
MMDWSQVRILEYGKKVSDKNYKEFLEEVEKIF